LKSGTSLTPGTPMATVAGGRYTLGDPDLTPTELLRHRPRGERVVKRL
jgi:hypothetical protein